MSTGQFLGVASPPFRSSNPSIPGQQGPSTDGQHAQAVTVPFFREWFAPIIETAGQRQQSGQSFLLDAEDVRKEFLEFGLDIEEQIVMLDSPFRDPEKVVRHYIRGVGMFGEELSPLPWKAREDLIQELIERGRFVCEKYPENERVIHFPIQWIKTRVKNK